MKNCLFKISRSWVMAGVLFFLFSPMFSLGQEKVFPDSMCNSYHPPLVLLKGERLVSQCDSLFVINGLRYRLYEKAKWAVINLNYSTTGSLIAEYERALSMRDSLNQELAIRFKQSDSICNNSLNQTIKGLTETNKTLEVTKGSLIEAQKSLEEANKIIKNQVFIRKKEKIMWGLGGFGLGLITGFVIGSLN